MQRFAGAALSFLAWAVPNNAHAESQSSKEALQAVIRTMPYDLRYPEAEERKTFAMTIEAYWKDFDQRIPRLSPREADWVVSEFSMGGDRMMRAIRSKEYAIYELNKLTDRCLRTLGKLRESYDSDQARQTEMFFWVQLINCYDGSGDTKTFLSQANIPHNDDAGQHVQVLTAEGVIQRAIVDKVAPAAMADTMGWTLTPD